MDKWVFKCVCKCVYVEVCVKVRGSIYSKREFLYFLKVFVLRMCVLHCMQMNEPDRGCNVKSNNVCFSVCVTVCQRGVCMCVHADRTVSRRNQGPWELSQ